MTKEALRNQLEVDVLEAAPALLGWRVRSPWGEGRIVETEAYRGSDDPGCHAFGRTGMKNPAMFGSPGTAYVYLSYGCHWMLNVVAHPVGDPSAVLIRALEPITGEFALRRPGVSARDWLRGPGRLTKALEIGPEDNGMNLLDADSRVVLLPPDQAVGEIGISCRIGLSLGKGEERPWRFFDRSRSRWVSVHTRVVGDKAGLR